MEEIEEKTGQRGEHKKIKLRGDKSSRRLYSIIGKAMQWQTHRLL